MIVTNPALFAELKRNNILIATSGGFDPIHIGHLRCILSSKKAALVHEHDMYYGDIKLVVIVNGTNFLVKKKGYEFIPWGERLEIVDSIKDVDYVFPWEQEGNDSSVCGALELIKPKYFTKGGDRVIGHVPEEPICLSLGCKILYSVGGGKIQSSSTLVSNVANNK